MPNERDIQTPSGMTFRATAEDRKENEVINDVGTFRARMAAVLDRGVINDRLTIDIPKNLHGEWVVNDPFELERAAMLGFTDGSEYVSKRLAHHQDGKPTMGDVRFMVQPMWMHKEVIAERERRFNEMHNPKKKRQKEEEEFRVNAGLPVIEESNVVVNKVAVNVKK
jgi:hypothetical protein